MQKFYFLSVIFLSCLVANAQQQITLSCVKDVTFNIDGTSCSRVVNNIDPILPYGVSQGRVSYVLEGATNQKGIGSASGLRFNAGRTKVTYTFPLSPVLECSFNVTIINRDAIIPELKDLDTLRGNCPFKVSKAPTARNKCTGDTLVAITNDPLSYSQPGTYHIKWQYFLYGQLMLTRVQIVIVSSAFDPDLNTLPDIVGKCFAEVTTAPTGLSICTGRRIRAITRDPVIYNRPGTFIVNWVYVEAGDTIYRQSQRVIVRERVRIIPDIDSLPGIIANCSITITKFPTAKNSCTDSVLRAVPLTPVKYDRPGMYTIHWLYIDKTDTLSQSQRVTVRPAIIIPDIDSLPSIITNCSITITKYPTAKNSCTDSVLIAFPLTPVKYDQPGSYLLRWRYIDRRDTLVQVQQLIVRAGKIIPDIDTLPVIRANCFVSITRYPTAKNSCTDSVIVAVPLTPVKYDQPGSYLLRWRYVYRKDTLIQVQQLIVQAGKIIPDIDTLPVIRANCFVSITKYPTAKNSCTDSVLVAVPLTPVKYDQPGSYLLRWRYIDRKDTLMQVQQLIVRAGRIIPDIDTLPIIQANCFASITKYPTAKSGCTDSVLVAVPLTSVRYDQPGSYLLRWRYIDRRDTLIQVQQLIVRAGRILPDIDTLPVIRANCLVSITKYPTAKNSCTDSVLIAVPLTPVKYDQPGSYILRWRYIDRRDTLIQVQQVIVLAGRIIPDIDTLRPIYANCSITITKYPTAKNSCTDSVLIAVPLTPVKYDQPGSYLLRWRYIDRRDSLIQVQQLIVQAARLIPDIDTLPVIIGGCVVKLSKFPTAKNPCTGAVITGATQDPLNYDQPGNYFIRWRFVDKYDSLVQVQQVIVKPGTLVPDSVTLPVVRGCSVKITNIPTASNSCTNSTIKATTKDPLNYDVQGRYTIRWIYSDNRDTVEQLQQVEVLSGQLVPDEDTLQVLTGKCAVTVEKRPTAYNSCNGRRITGTTNDPLQYDVAGKYKINWIFDDSIAGSRITQSQNIIVEDAGQLIPDVGSLPDLVADCSITVTKIPTATNTCNGATVSASTTDPVIYTRPGNYTIHWTYTSKNQATVVQIQNVTITGNSVLVPEMSNLPDLQGICSVVISDVPLAKNKCNGNVIRAITNDPLVYAGAGDYKIRWIYVDGRDTVTQDQSVSIVSNGRLVADKQFLSPIIGDCEVRVDKFPTATNSCSRKVFTATTSDPLVYSIPGTYSIRWTIREGANVIQQTQTVVVNAVAETIKVGPNPTRDEFRIIRGGCGLSQKISLRVYDIAGRLMEAKEYSVSDNIRFGASYPRGSYVVQVIWGEKRFVYKLIKRP